jgi:hypothetical protein
MLKNTRILLPLLALIGHTPAAFGFISASFIQDHCIWNATHIVVVTEGDKIDGIVEVKESWRGDLKEGASITIPELAEFAPEEKRAVRKGLSAILEEEQEPAMKVTHVTGKRMVLFLRKKEEKAGLGKQDKVTWELANRIWKRMDVSVAWVEAERMYAIVQESNPGPSAIYYRGTTETKMKDRVLQIVKMQEALTKAIGRSDPDKVVDAVMPLLKFDSYYVGDEAVETLGQSGKDGLAILRKLLQDESCTGYHPGICRALAQAGGAKAGPDLTAVVKQELRFWKEIGPGLKPGWWNGEGLEWKEVEHLRLHYSKVHAALQALREIRFPGCRETVKDFRDCWLSLGKASITQLSEACDDVLKQPP